MKITRIIALGVITTSLGLPVLQAQTLNTSGPPAEFPPASYKGSQFVDSRGCVYIRAGVDGAVTWVPRVSRQRKQICGQTPTVVTGATARPAQRAAAAELITLPAGQQPAAASAAQTAVKPVTPVKPKRSPAPAAAAPAAVIATAPPKPAQVKPKPAAAAATAADGNKCEGVSELSQRYMNPGARCGPQAASPVATGAAIGPQSSLRLTPNTRVVPVHVYQERRQSRHLEVPAGYRRVWSDDRLNPQRAVRTLKPAVLNGKAQVPAGYALSEREDGRLNPIRGHRTPEGDAQMAQVWTNEVPRRLTGMPLDRRVVRLPQESAFSPAEADEGMVLRLSTRSDPNAAGLPVQPQVRRRYVRAATFAGAAEARQAAQQLAAAGLPVRLGTVSRNGASYKVVLAGPFLARDNAEQALARVRAAGYRGARLSK